MIEWQLAAKASISMVHIGLQEQRDALDLIDKDYQAAEHALTVLNEMVRWVYSSCCGATALRGVVITHASTMRQSSSGAWCRAAKAGWD